MFVSRRRLASPSLGALVLSEIVSDRPFSLKLWTTHGVVLEDALFDPSWMRVVDGWPTLTLALST